MQPPHLLLHLLLCLLPSLCLIPALKPDLTSDKASLLALRSSLAGRTIQLWNASHETPCSWTGVKCQGSRVTVLRLPGASLSGQIPTGIFRNLTHLRTLSLRLNALTGQLPSDLAACTNLRSLYLQGNAFSGPIPEFVFQFHDLVRLNLASNNFSGVLSPRFDKLRRLKTLFLENNRLTGSLPELKLPNLVQFNVSNNFFNGSVPRRFQSFPFTAFMGNPLCGRPFENCARNVIVPLTVDIDVNENKRRKNLSGAAVGGIVMGSVLGLVLFCVILTVSCRRQSGRKTSTLDMTALVDVGGEKAISEENGGYENGCSVAATAALENKKGEGDDNVGGAKKLVFFGNAGGRVFDLEDLLRASAEVLGKGTFGTAYKAVLEIGAVVAVKRLKDVSVCEREFREKIEGVGVMEHQNLVALKAYYYSVDEKLLVYDYMAMGSLSTLLHGNKGTGRTPLNWEMRRAIACGAARGIKYLHSQGPNVSHGNIKSSNILLAKSYDARVSDFGLAQLVGPASSPNRVVGYRAPEVTDSRKVSQKADVYSFGVLLLELLTGKAPSHAVLNEEGVDLPRWVQSVLQEEWRSEVFDAELLRYESVEEEMVKMLELAVDCAAQHPDRRPSMYEVSSRIEELCSPSAHSNPQQHNVGAADKPFGASTSHSPNAKSI
ncbi:putative inactive receptor kinase [Cucurbita argyrosperma subsp. argyrosperma]